jgi:hypothetical protein
MAITMNEHLGDVRRRIDRLEVKAQLGTEDSKSRMQRYIETLRRDEESARASARERAAAVEERFEQLDNDLELAEHRVAAEFAETESEFNDALEAELHRWDAYLDRMQTKAAAETGVARERAEAAVADLRQRRVSIGKTHSDVGTAAGEGWSGAKVRVLAELDELKAKADAAWRNEEEEHD